MAEGKPGSENGTVRVPGPIVVSCAPAHAETELASWRHALDLAIKGDASELATHATYGRVPEALRDEFERLLLAAPWATRPGGRAPKLSWAQKRNAAAAYVLCVEGGGKFNGLPANRATTLDFLARTYNVSPETIKRALREFHVARDIRAIRARRKRQNPPGF
jgi:hypothetical protein